MTHTSVDTGNREDPRIGVNFRIRRTAKTRLETLAHQHSLPGKPVAISDVIRASLAVAAQRPAELALAITKIRDSR